MANSTSEAKKLPLMTDAESKSVGWDDDMIEQYPHKGLIPLAGRTQLIGWHRFLREPVTPEEVAFIDGVAVQLEATCPMFTDFEVHAAFDVEVAGIPELAWDKDLLQSVGELEAEAADAIERDAADALTELLRDLDTGE